VGRSGTSKISRYSGEKLAKGVFEEVGVAPARDDLEKNVGK